MKQYIVQPGDTLYGIARQFDTTVDNIKKLNNLQNNNIFVGQILTIQESTNPTDSTYIVQKGDSIYSISQKFNIPVLDLLKINNLTSTVLQIGQKLNLVDEESSVVMSIPLYEDYTVQSGDRIFMGNNR